MGGRHARTHRRRRSKYAGIAGLLSCGLWLVGCVSAATTPSATPQPEGRHLADVISVDVSGDPNAYTFSVGVSSSDTGCSQYADWWEVISEKGELLYRRILLHSHVTEQPFVHSGGTIAISADAIVIVRAHMAPGGYGGTIVRGSAAAGFVEMPGDLRFAAELEGVGPLPASCAF